MKNQKITVAARSEAWTAFGRSNTGVTDLNPTWGMDVSVCVYCVFVLSCEVGGDFATRWSPVQGIPPDVYTIKKLEKKLRPQNGL
jgi:hypothetical protein